MRNNLSLLGYFVTFAVVIGGVHLQEYVHYKYYGGAIINDIVEATSAEGLGDLRKVDIHWDRYWVEYCIDEDAKIPIEFPGIISPNSETAYWKYAKSVLFLFV